MNSKKIQCYDAHGKVYQFAEVDFIDRISVYGLYAKDNRILLVQDSVSNKWELPGGGVEENETDTECLEREFCEETGLRVGGGITFLEEHTSYFFDITSKKPWRALRRFYLVKSILGTLRRSGNKEDVQRVELVKKQKINSLQMNNRIRKIIQSNLS